jgi:hypothetical protein
MAVETSGIHSRTRSGSEMVLQQPAPVASAGTDPGGLARLVSIASPLRARTAHHPNPWPQAENARGIVAPVRQLIAAPTQGSPSGLHRPRWGAGGRAISLAIRSRTRLSNISRFRVFRTLQVDRPLWLCCTWTGLSVHQGWSGCADRCSEQSLRSGRAPQGRDRRLSNPMEV